MSTVSVTIGDDSSERVLNPLELGNIGLGTTVEERVAIVKARRNKGSCNRFGHVISKGWADVSEGS